MLSKNIKIIKLNQYTYEVPDSEDVKPRPLPMIPVIKRYMINYSYEEKFKLGILTPQEYAAWQYELQEKNSHALEDSSQGAPALTGPTVEEALSMTVEEEDFSGATFWANGTGDRNNVSNDDYSKFLSENNLDVTNRTSVDFDALVRAQENDASPF